MQKGAYAAVRSFFDNNYQPLKLRRSDAPSGESIGKRVPEKKEIKQIMSVAKSLRDRALISFAKDCGWRLGDIADLTWGDIKDLGDGFWHFKKITKKRHIKAQGFVGPETTELMNLYRRKRERGTKGEGRGKGYPGIPPENITDSSPLFITYNPRKDNRFQPMSAKRMSHVLSQACSDVGLDDVSAHSLRKYFQTTMENPKLRIHKTWIKQFMGKKIIASDKPYVEKRVRKLFEAYKDAYNSLGLEEKALSEKERRIQAIIDNARMMGTSEEKIHRVVRMLARKRVMEPDEVINMLKQRNEPEDPNDCPDGQNCGEQYEEISEDNLLQYLRQGWQIIHKLEDGRVIIKKAQP